MEIEIILWIILWIILCVVIGLLGKNRKIGSAGAFFLSLILSPLIGLIIVLISNPRKIQNQISPIMTKLINEGDQLFLKQKYKSAIEKYNEALKYSDKAPATHFKLAKAYSMTKNKEESLKHLKQSISDGYKNFDRVQNDKELSYIRDSVEFKDFERNNYKVENNNTNKTSGDDKYDKLEKLNRLFKEGILSEKEFRDEKIKILNED